MGLLTIELIDDFLNDSNNIYSSSVDKEVFYDIYGFPFIPAWIIRNSLRKLAEKLLDETETISIFGDSTHKSALDMENAIIASWASMRYAIIMSKDPRLVSVLRILRQFTKAETYIRDGKKCTCRLIKSGTFFEQCFRIPDQYRNAFELLARNLNSLVCGPGRVRCYVTWDRNEYDYVYGSCGNASRPLIFPKASKTDTYLMEFSLTVLSSVCVHEPTDTTNNSADFIPGNLIKACLQLPEPISERVRVSSAYVDIEGKRGIPSPVSFSVLKTDKNQLRDHLSDGRRADDFDQLSRLPAMYIADTNAQDLTACSVNQEYVGFPVTDTETNKEHMIVCRAIAVEQIFRGFFEGSASDLRYVRKQISNNPYLKIGNYTEEGLGLCRLAIESVSKAVSCKNQHEAKEIRVEAVSPLAIRFENGLYTASTEVFLEEMKRLLGADDLEIVRVCKDTEMIQGCTEKWLKRNPVMHLIKKGSVFRLRRTSGKAIQLSQKTCFIGDFTYDGFGELLITPMTDRYYRTIINTMFNQYTVRLDNPYDIIPGRALVRQMKAEIIRDTAHSFGIIDSTSFRDLFYKEAKTLQDDTLGYEADDSLFLETYTNGLNEGMAYLLNTKYEQ